MTGPSTRQVGRRRRKDIIRAEGQWYGMGKQEEDVYSGWLFPVKLMTTATGTVGLVSRSYADGSLDLRKEW